MDDESFRHNLCNFLTHCNMSDVITQIPEGSGVFRITNVSPERFDAAWVSQIGGRFSKPGEKVMYYANEFDVCAKELGYPPGPIPGTQYEY